MASPVALVPVCWPLSSLAETATSNHASAACYRASEHVGIEAVVISELKLGNIERHIFCAHFVERADQAAFEERPETVMAGLVPAIHVFN